MASERAPRNGQIDTWHREKMDVAGGPFVPGPYPEAAYAPRSGPDAIYSGLLECPLTTRIEKLHDSNDTAVPFGKGSGYLRYKPTGEKVRFPADRCLPYPREDVLAERNPSCDLRTYTGGLVACHHGHAQRNARERRRRAACRHAGRGIPRVG